MKRESKKKKLDKIVKGVFTYWIVFVSIAWITYWIKGDIPDTLVEFGLGGGTLELVCSAAIEILSNTKKKEDTDE